MFILPQRATVAHLEVQAISNPLTEGQGGHLTYLLALKIPHAGRVLKKMPLVPKPTLAGCALWLLPVRWWIAPQITVIHSAIPGFESTLLLGWDPENPTRPLGVRLIWGHGPFRAALLQMVLPQWASLEFPGLSFGSFSFSAASEILRLFILSYISPLSNLLSENKSEKFICTEVNVTDNSCYISSPWNSYILAKRMCPALQNFRHENVNGGKMLLVVGIFWYPVKRTKKGIVWLLSL